MDDDGPFGERGLLANKVYVVNAAMPQSDEYRDVVQRRVVQYLQSGTQSHYKLADWHFGGLIIR